MPISYPHLPSIGIHLFVIIALTALVAYLWHYRRVPGVATFMLTTVLRVLWLTGAVIISESSSPFWQSFWNKVSWTAGIALVPAWLVLVLQISGQDAWLTRRRFASLVALPILFSLLVFSNEWHGWLDTGTPLHWMILGYSYLLVLFCYYFNLRWIRQSSGLRRWQAIAVALAPLFSVAGQVLSVSANLTNQSSDFKLLLPIGFLLASLIWFWALLYLRVFTLVPVAKDAVINAMSDGFVVVDYQGYIYELNPAAAATLSIASGEAVGRPATEIFSVWPALNEIALQRNVTERETLYERADGDRYYTLQSAPLSDPGGRFLGTVIIWHDTTERHLAHAQLKLMEESRRRLLANISHDLRTPVSSVLGHSELLLEEIVDSPEQQRTYLKRIHAKMLGFNRLIQDLFELARIESQSDRFRMARLPLAPLIEKVYEKYLSDVQNAAIRFHCDIAVAADISVSVDEDRLDQVFANLIANATRYVSKQGSIVIRCSLTALNPEGEAFPDGKSMALLSVSDDGPGIPPEHIANIFERFYRGNESQSAASEHSGLGLAISKEIVIAHGGQIWVDEAAQQGCTICFSLPILD